MLQQILNSFKKMGEAGIYYAFGIIMLLIGRLVWNLITKYNANDEIGNKDNESAGIAEFGFLIAYAIIIYSVISDSRTSRMPIYVDLIISFGWTVFGFITLAAGKFILDLFTPFKLDDEIARDKNNGAGWLQAGFYIAIAVILIGVLK